MKIPDIIIAIDGYSSTGKSSLAKKVAQKFGFLYLDSGALYRGVTLFAQEESLINRVHAVSPALKDALKGLDLHFEADGRLYMGPRCIEQQIRSMEVSAQVSPIAAVPYVREWVDEKLHEFGRRGRIVMDGRDIGTAVFPDAARERPRCSRRWCRTCASATTSTRTGRRLPCAAPKTPSSWTTPKWASMRSWPGCKDSSRESSASYDKSGDRRAFGLLRRGDPCHFIG